MFTNTPAPGAIYHATVFYRLADATSVGHETTILIYDVRVGGEQDWPKRIMWTLARRDRDGGWTPYEMPRWSVIDSGGRDLAPHGDAVIRVELDEYVEDYKPRSPQHNSIESLRDAAIARLVTSREWNVGPYEDVAAAADAYHLATTDKEGKQRTLYELIRAAIAVGAKGPALARASRLSPQRIYQIRDEQPITA